MSIPETLENVRPALGPFSHAYGLTHQQQRHVVTTHN